jgi:uncharacterized protein involved in type VI secretion and phage assembly
MPTRCTETKDEEMNLYRAVVEDNNDPEKYGRVRVRIIGVHPESTSGSFGSVTASDLPWAEVMGGTAFGLVSGVGVSSVLRKGTWVWVVLNEDNPNKPIVVGVVIAKQSGKKSGGFSDPDGKYPKAGRETRSDMHPLLDSKYQTLSVLETESGHVIELDDTSGDERVKVTHKSGSSILIGPDGTITVNSVKDINYSAAANSTWNIGGNLNITTGGSQTVSNGGAHTVHAPSINLN